MTFWNTKRSDFSTLTISLCAKKFLIEEAVISSSIAQSLKSRKDYDRFKRKISLCKSRGSSLFLAIKTKFVQSILILPLLYCPIRSVKKMIEVCAQSHFSLNNSFDSDMLSKVCFWISLLFINCLYLLTTEPFGQDQKDSFKESILRASRKCCSHSNY